MQTTLVNLRKEKCDVKICRTRKNEIPKPPQDGCFGNPFFLKNVNNDAERTEVIEKYRQYFLERIEIDNDFRDAVLSLRGKKLGCFCYPKACHGSVIIEWLENNL